MAARNSSLSVVGTTTRTRSSGPTPLMARQPHHGHGPASLSGYACRRAALDPIENQPVHLDAFGDDGAEVLARLFGGCVALDHDRPDVRVLLFDLGAVRRPEGDVLLGEGVVPAQPVGDDRRTFQVLALED